MHARALLRSAWKNGALAVCASLLLPLSVDRADVRMVPVPEAPASVSHIMPAPQSIHEAPMALVPSSARSTKATLLAAVDHDDILPRHRALADATIRSLPPGCKENLKNFYVIYDAANTNRGLGGANTILVTGLVPDDEFRALLIHECGHVTDLGGLTGTPESGTTEFYDGQTPIYADDPSLAFYRISWRSATKRIAGSKGMHFASGYAATNVFEDFAEHFALYALHREAFASLAEKNPILAQKYAFMRDEVFGKRADIATSTYTPGQSIPWDITKLPYTWYAANQ